jgi:hypothetical protein
MIRAPLAVKRRDEDGRAQRNRQKPEEQRKTGESLLRFSSVPLF